VVCGMEQLLKGAAVLNAQLFYDTHRAKSNPEKASAPRGASGAAAKNAGTDTPVSPGAAQL